jgi:hypothetical protein
MASMAKHLLKNEDFDCLSQVAALNKAGQDLFRSRSRSQNRPGTTV